MFGFVPTIQTIVVIGIALFTLVCFQISLGKRWIKLPGRIHWKVHRWVAYTIFTVALVHGLFGLTIAGIIRIG